MFLGGDLFPSGLGRIREGQRFQGGFLDGLLVSELSRIRGHLGRDYPRIFLILGNDDGKSEEDAIRGGAESGLWEYIHSECRSVDGFSVYGYAYVPPTPFLLKDWERYDVSRYVPPGGVSPEEGIRSVDAAEHWVRYGTIKSDLEELTSGADLSRSVMLFHTPPYETKLDRAATDGKSVDHVPLDLHVGSIAVRRFIETRRPLLTLHGHIHESASITGSWRDRIGSTLCFSAAHDGPELALVRFDLENPEKAERVLI